MTDSITIELPQQLILPVPEPASALLTYALMGLTITAISQFFWPFEESDDYGLSEKLLEWPIMAVGWMPIILLILKDMEHKLREENLYEEFREEIRR